MIYTRTWLELQPTRAVYLYTGVQKFETVRHTSSFLVYVSHTCLVCKAFGWWLKYWLSCWSLTNDIFGCYSDCPLEVTDVSQSWETWLVCACRLYCGLWLFTSRYSIKSQQTYIDVIKVLNFWHLFFVICSAGIGRSAVCGDGPAAGG
jgi:hypothetical protein